MVWTHQREDLSRILRKEQKKKKIQLQENMHCINTPAESTMRGKV